MTILLVAAEFMSWPLWVMPDDDIAGNTAPSSLPISPALAQALVDWGDAHDLTLDQDYPPNSGFVDESAAALWLSRGAELASRLEQELAHSGSAYAVRYGHAEARPSDLVREPPLAAPENPLGSGAS